MENPNYNHLYDPSFHFTTNVLLHCHFLEALPWLPARLSGGALVQGPRRVPGSEFIPQP